MVAAKGLSTFKSRVSVERETRKSGGIKSLEVYTEDDKVKMHIQDHVSAEAKRKSIPVKPGTSHISVNRQKEALNKLEKIHGKNINSTQNKIGKRVLADISNSRSNFQKNEAIDGRPSLIRVNTKDLKVFNAIPITRKSFPVFKHVEKADKSDINKGNLDTKVINKEKHGLSVKPKVGTAVVPQVNNIPNYHWKNRISDGYIKLDSEGQPMGDVKRLSRVSMKPTVKTAVGIPRTTSAFAKPSSATSVLTKKESKSRSVDKVLESQPKGDAKRLSWVSMKPTVKTTVNIPRPQKESRKTSVFTKPSSSTSVLTKKESKSKSSSRSSISKHSETSSCEQNVEASTSTVYVKAKSGRRKSYTSLLIESTKLFKENVTKDEILPEIYDDCNQLEVAEYIDEIYQHYWVTEAHNQSLKNYMGIQTDITPQMRGILVNWLIEVHLKFDLMQETLYLMVTLLDYYLSVVNIKKNEIQLVGLTSLLLASKYEDFWHPKVMELISISAEIYTRDQMLEMETTILKKLNFRLNWPTPYVFMLRFLKAAQGSKKFEKLAYFLIELCLVEYDALNFKPSLLCASAIYLARCTLQLTPSWTPLLCKHSHYQEFQIRDCADMILKFHKAARMAVLRVTCDKYMSGDNYKVAMIKPLDRLPRGNV